MNPIELFVLDGNLQKIDIVDTYESLIWSNRYDSLGDCELYLPATTYNLDILRKGYYLQRTDDPEEMICRIEKVELGSDVETGNYLIITGCDAKKFLDQRIIAETRNCNGNVESFVRKLVDEALGNASANRQLKKNNGNRLLYLGTTAGFTEELQEQVSYDNLGEKVREYCTSFGWGYKVSFDEETLKFELCKGTDRSRSVLFSHDFENLKATKYVEDSSDLANVALVAGEGEGSERQKESVGYGQGVDRYEYYADARDISKSVTWSDLIKLYPLKADDGVGEIVGLEYILDYLDIKIHDKTQLESLKEKYINSKIITSYGNIYLRIYHIPVADLPSETPQESDTCTLKDILYSAYLINRGYEKLSEFGESTSFEGSIDPNTTFEYKNDYFLGDIVSVENEFGISVKARITEVVEVMDTNGYSVEPKFVYNHVNKLGNLATEAGIDISDENNINLEVE